MTIAINTYVVVTMAASKCLTQWRQKNFDATGSVTRMLVQERPEAAVLREWLDNRAQGSPAVAGAHPATVVQAVLDALAREDAELPVDVLSACAVMLMAARSESDRLELQLMRAASDRGQNWTVIAQAFGYRSKQAAHARASALFHRLEYRTS